jgi:hypothetical protein
VINLGEFGLKIKNIEASTLFEHNNGVRDHYEYKDAMFVNSLFKDFLDANGLENWKDESTRDIICLEFNYGSRSFKDEMDHLEGVMRTARREFRNASRKKDLFLMEKALKKRKKLSDLTKNAVKNKKNYQKLSKEELRILYYNEGVEVPYKTYSRDGAVKKTEVIKYKMLYRSTGKAKRGSCMFIRQELYDKARNFLYMGMELPKENAPIVEASAYVPLISSGIVGRIKINPRNVLILEDVDRFFTTNVISIETDKDRHCVAKHLDNYKLKNTMFDGQALIDSSIFPEWGNGYVLLRHHFFKAAAFCTNIQKFFKDYFGDEYETAKVTDMFGIEHFVKDVEMITTDNAVKWTKKVFGISYDYWCRKVEENGCTFGVVKTAHPSKLGVYQKMSYQMVNSLNEKTMESVCKESVDYVYRLKADGQEFMDFLLKNRNFSNDFEFLHEMCKYNPDFERSSYFRERKRKIIENYVLGLKNGELIQNGDNLTIVGSPYAMLLYAATGNPDDVDKDTTFAVEEGTIQCYSERFDDGEYLAGFRSPFNSKNNMDYLHNHYDERFKKYFTLGKNIIAVNMNCTDFQEKNNGSDQDSDMLYVTNQQAIVDHAMWCYENYPTIVNNIPKDKNIYSSSMDDYAKVDNLLSASQTDIGESSNLAQVAQSYSYTFSDPRYDDYCAILAVCAQLAIDSSKRRFDIDIPAEIKLIKKQMDVKANKYPMFWSVIRPGFNKNNLSSLIHCPMNYLYNLRFKPIKPDGNNIPMNEFFIKHKLDVDKRKCKKVEELIQKYSLEVHEEKLGDGDTDYLLLRSDYDQLINDLRQITFSKNTIGLMSWLIDRAFMISPAVRGHMDASSSLLNKNRSLLIKILYDSNKQALFSCFKPGEKK